MKKHALLLVLVALFLTSCGRDYYSIATKNLSAANYTILNVQDSVIHALPYEYRNEPTPEVIREYGRFFSFDSVTRLHKISGGQTIGTTVAAGVLAGAIVGAVIGAASYHRPVCNNTFICLDFGPGISILGGGLLGIIPGGIAGYIFAPKGEDLLPMIGHRKESATGF